ncbi:MAG: nucleotidyltransferase domain-containing protein [Methanofollis sp.]|uniref:nucleotidyltransferase domain-containing protein n=1 Tax=Methanofollis sp. TaxID=2052835 RepID=UPI002626D39D|nr:nucleotidyltransferase domain-containing protein [Methanofollis sp.]MDD4255326.1 nucleotidyltransferase domain-containing protein [Methanofollis sp.]
MTPIRLRDFVEDRDGLIYAVSAYDNAERVGCVLRYVPDPAGKRVDPAGRHFSKLDFGPAFEYIREHKPEYLDDLHRVPPADIVRVYKPDERIDWIASRDERVKRLLSLFDLPAGSVGCTGSRLLGVENGASDIDLVVYGPAWFSAQAQLKRLVAAGKVPAMSEEMWRKVYTKRVPEISFDAFVLHEGRKWNRGEFGGTYFDLLYTRAYDALASAPAGKGRVLGRATIEATVTDASHAFDAPAVYEVEHETVSRVISFTHTYSGQALAGETIEAQGVLEQHGDTQWLIVGTTREAKGEYILSKTLMEQG